MASTVVGLLDKRIPPLRPTTVHTQEVPSQPPTDDADSADKALEALGYKPVFKREFSQWSSFSFAMSISGIYATLMSAWVYGLQAGGAAAIVWSWLIGGLGSWAVAVSIAEIASAYPTSGAMYFTLKFLAPESQVPMLSWIVGYLNFTGTITGSASTEYASAQMLLAAISVASDFTYLPTQAHILGVMALLTITHAIINSLSTSWLNRLTKIYAVLHIAILVAACVCLLVLEENKHSVQYIFTNFQSTSGWSPPGFAFLFGCLTPAWIMTNADSTVRIAEEAKDPARIVPNAIVSASTFTLVVGFLFNIVLVACMGDPTSLLQSPTGQPVTQLFYNVMGRRAAVLFTMAGFLVMNMTMIPGLQAASRTVFAFARDDLLPLSRVWRRIDRRSQTPLAAVWLVAALAIGVTAAVGLASGSAIAAVFNVCAVALNVAYSVPLACKLARCRGAFVPGPWHLGRWGGDIVNAVALAWSVFISIVFLLPTQRPVTSGNMNYAIVVFAVVVLVSTVFWMTHGRFHYIGPRTETQADQTGQVMVATEDVPSETEAKNVGRAVVANAATENVE